MIEITRTYIATNYSFLRENGVLGAREGLELPDTAVAVMYILCRHISQELLPHFAVECIMIPQLMVHDFHGLWSLCIEYQLPIAVVV